MQVLLRRHLTATQGSLWVRAGPGGVVQGSYVPGPGAPQLTEAVLGVWDVQQLLETPSCLAAMGQEGSSCCPLGLLLWDAPAPSSAPRDSTLAVGKVFPQCVITRGRCKPSHMDPLLTPGEVCLHVSRA